MSSKDDKDKWCEVDVLGDWLLVSRDGVSVAYNMSLYPRVQLVSGRLVIRQVMPKVERKDVAPIIIPFDPAQQNHVLCCLKGTLRSPSQLGLDDPPASS